MVYRLFKSLSFVIMAGVLFISLAIHGADKKGGRKHAFVFKIHSDLKPMKFVLYDIPKNKYEFKKIEIYHAKESSPFQTLDGGTATPNQFRLIECLDMNFDGYKDIRSIEEFASGNTRYHVWLYNPKTEIFDYHQEYRGLVSPHFNNHTKTIHTCAVGGHASAIHVAEEYKIIDGKLTLLKRYRQYYNKKDDNYLYIVWKRVNGKMKEVEHGVVPDK